MEASVPSAGSRLYQAGYYRLPDFKAPRAPRQQILATAVGIQVNSYHDLSFCRDEIFLFVIDGTI